MFLYVDRQSSTGTHSLLTSEHIKDFPILIHRVLHQSILFLEPYSSLFVLAKFSS